MRTVAVLCASLLAVGLLAKHLAGLSFLEAAIQRSPARYPSSVAVPPGELDRPGSVLSVYTEERYLRDPDHGLLTNPELRGRDWEHPATVSYYEDGELKFASSTGLRVHGGASRRHPRPSFRLHFRGAYDPAQFRVRRLFGGKRGPLTTLIVHNDRRRGWRLTNPLAYDIARRTGAVAPETHPVSFVLNGKPQGLYVLTEPVGKWFLRSRYGHDDFEWVDPGSGQRPVVRNDSDLADPPPRRSWADVMKNVKHRASFTLADATSWIDVESLTRWFISVVFCATTEVYQAAILRDRTRPDSKWFWVNWDMDNSFGFGRVLVPWRHDTFRRITQPPSNRPESDRPESLILGRLVAEDPAYRAYLARAFLDALNYRLTPAFLDERYRYYRAVAERFGLENEPYLEILANFLRFRPGHVREQLVRHLELDPLRQVRVEGRPGTIFRIDGHAVSAGFSGWYARGMDIRVEVEAAPGDFSHWIVEGRRVRSAGIRHRVEDADVVIEAAFRP